MDKNKEAKIYSILKSLRKDLCYSVAVSEITSLSLDAEKSAAFLIYIVTSCLGHTYAADIVLASFALLKEYGDITSIDTRRGFISMDLRYRGRFESLYRIENTAYQKMAKYLSPFYQNKDASIKLVKSALKSEFYDQENKKAIRPVSFNKLKRMEGAPIRHFINNPKQLFSLNAETEMLKMLDFNPLQIVYVDWLLSVVFPEPLIDAVLNSPKNEIYYPRFTEEEQQKAEAEIREYYENYRPKDVEIDDEPTEDQPF